MSRPRPVRRVIEPHAVAFDGFRWHARAFDLETEEFRDFVLGRISKARVGAAASNNGAGDHDWQMMVDLVIAPHPALSESQARAIALDYGIVKGSTRLSVRRALLFYALKRLGLDEDHSTRPPNVQQIVLLNRAEVAPHLRNPAT
jgi:predicted DNA-binding transcriptional regulator YafY